MKGKAVMGLGNMVMAHDAHQAIDYSLSPYRVDYTYVAYEPPVQGDFCEQKFNDGLNRGPFLCRTLSLPSPTSSGSR